MTNFVHLALQFQSYIEFSEIILKLVSLGIVSILETSILSLIVSFLPYFSNYYRIRDILPTLVKHSNLEMLRESKLLPAVMKYVPGVEDILSKLLQEAVEENDKERLTYYLDIGIFTDLLQVFLHHGSNTPRQSLVSLRMLMNLRDDYGQLTVLKSLPSSLLKILIEPTHVCQTIETKDTIEVE